ncbi:unnamed protein product [Bubo scandiacus]
MSSLQFHFLQTLEHRTDVSVTSTPPWWEAREERGAPWGSSNFFPRKVSFCCLSSYRVLVCAFFWRVGSEESLSRRR